MSQQSYPSRIPYCAQGNQNYPPSNYENSSSTNKDSNSESSHISSYMYTNNKKTKETKINYNSGQQQLQIQSQPSTTQVSATATKTPHSNLVDSTVAYTPTAVDSDYGSSWGSLPNSTNEVIVNESPQPVIVQPMPVLLVLPPRYREVKPSPAVVLGIPNILIYI